MKRLLIVLLVLILIAASGTGWWWVKNSLLPLDGQLSMPGLRAPVEILFDDHGVPAVYARDVDDASPSPCRRAADGRKRPPHRAPAPPQDAFRRVPARPRCRISELYLPYKPRPSCLRSTAPSPSLSTSKAVAAWSGSSVTSLGSPGSTGLRKV